MNKRLVIVIIIVILLLATFAGLLVWAVKKNNQKQASTTEAALQIKKIVNDRVISPTASPDNKIWYFNSEGHLFSIQSDGSGVSEFPLPSLSSGILSRVSWPKTGTDFITVSTTAASAKSFYDSNKKIYINLPNNIRNFDWMPDGKRILYIWAGTDNKSQLILANADGTGFKKISDVFWPDLAVKISPDAKTSLLYRTDGVGTTNKVYSVDLTSGVISTVLSFGKNTGVLWLPSGKGFIFSQSSDTLNSKLLLFDNATKKVTDLKINTTLDKIIIDNDSKILYASVPKIDNKTDSFIKLDLSTFSQETYFEPAAGVRAKNLFLVGQSIYFINTTDGKLYSLGK